MPCEHYDLIDVYFIRLACANSQYSTCQTYSRHTKNLWNKGWMNKSLAKRFGSEGSAGLQRTEIRRTESEGI